MKKKKKTCIIYPPPTLKITGGIPSGPGALIASLQLRDSLDGLCFCWRRAIENVDQWTLKHILSLLVFDAGGLVQQPAEVCCPALQDVGFLHQKCVI